MKNPLEFFPPYRKRKDKQAKQRHDEKALRARIKTANNLGHLWNELVHFKENSYIDPASLEDLSITVEDLTFNDDGLYETTPNPNFFEPSTKGYLGGLPPDRDDRRTKRMLEYFHDKWTNDSPLGLFDRPLDSDELCSWFKEWFEEVRRERPGEDKSESLRDLNWEKQHVSAREFVNLLRRGGRRKMEPFYSVLYTNSHWSPRHAWGSDIVPHVIMTMRSSIPSEDGSLVAEILAFVAVMWNRLVGGKLYPEHNIVPVMMFTFSDDLHGRILQAYHNDKGLVIRKSKLYEFTTEEKCTQNLNFFLQYLACSLEGSTRIFDAAPTHPKTPRAIMAAKASSAAVDLAARNDPNASNYSKPSNDAISSKDFAISSTPSGSDIPDASNDTATSDSPVALNASSDADSDTSNATNVSNNLSASNVVAAAVASNQPIASDASDGSNASHSRSSSSTHTFSSDDASKPSGSPGTPDTSFSSDLPDPRASSDFAETSIPSKRKRSTEEPREVV